MDDDKPDFRHFGQILCGKMAILMGWKPCEFWQSTPAEIASILLQSPQSPAPIDQQILQALIANENEK